MTLLRRFDIIVPKVHEDGHVVDTLARKSRGKGGTKEIQRRNES
jgi:hypothetical protein